MALLEDARDLLDAWRHGLVADEDVVTWADARIAASAIELIPEWLLDLSMHGPENCMRRPCHEFVHVPASPFGRAFAVRARIVELHDDRQVFAFVRWVSGACMGEDLKSPLVQFGYHVDHLWNDCNRMDLAAQLVRAELPSLIPMVSTIAEDVIHTMVSARRRAG